jgi:hypothetical protein
MSLTLRFIVLAITLCLFLLSLTEHLIECLLVIDYCWVNDHLIQLKIPASTVFNPHLKSTLGHQTVLTRLVALEELTTRSFLIKISGW